jgi:hypothetical protein
LDYFQFNHKKIRNLIKLIKKNKKDTHPSSQNIRDHLDQGFPSQEFGTQFFSFFLIKEPFWGSSSNFPKLLMEQLI